MFIQYSVKVGFQGQNNPQKCINPNKITLSRVRGFFKIIYTLNELVIYTFTFRYNLASRLF